ncbi:MAG TPA: MBL fold metallo-hydrolase [Bryobacteraceae bacterium]|nr:MBL fold metallo-hydrolase [Bryobacteraceae bacterium]
MKLTILLCSALLAAATASAQKVLQIYPIDVEGGQATLFVTPAGESLLVDAGWPGNNNRDAERIAAAAQAAHVKKIDYLWITHFHVDHVGGVQNLLAKLPVGTFVDHGANREVSDAAASGQAPNPRFAAMQPDRLYPEYLKLIGSSKHQVLEPGDRLPIKGVEVMAVSGDGKVLERALPGAGQPNAACSSVAKQADDPSENARSLGLVMIYGKFRVVDLGDLTWNKELDLMCPDNRIGAASLFIVSHHGMDISNSPALVHGIQPRVAIMDNSVKKGGKPAAWEVVKSSPGLEDLWQLQRTGGGADHNVEVDYIANTRDAAAVPYLKVVANKDGSFEVVNPRNQFAKKYAAR